ncbi:MAG: clostripain-related cysteine peptidase [bacterium]
MINQALNLDLPKKKWLVIHYGASDNDLAKFVYSDVDEMEKIGSNDSMHIVSVLDLGHHKGQNLYEGTNVFYITKDSQEGKINSQIVKSLGQVNTADPQFMSSILSEIIDKFPADNIALIISSHGMGWKGVVVDHGQKDYMTINELREALEKVVKEKGRKLNIIAFDACLMAMAEVGYELRSVTKYMVASQKIHGLGGYDYTTLLKGVRGKPKQVAIAFVNAAKKYYENINSLSAVDLSKASKLAKVLDSFASTLLKFSDNDITKVKDKLVKVQKFDFDFKDLKHFMELIVEDKEINFEIRQKAQEVIQVLDEYVVKEFHIPQYPNANGVNIEFDLRENQQKLKEYKQTLFAKDTKWDEMILCFDACRERVYN